MLSGPLQFTARLDTLSPGDMFARCDNKNARNAGTKTHQNKDSGEKTSLQLASIYLHEIIAPRSVLPSQPCCTSLQPAPSKLEKAPNVQRTVRSTDALHMATTTKVPDLARLSGEANDDLAMAPSLGTAAVKFAADFVCGAQHCALRQITLRTRGALMHILQISKQL